MSGLPDRAASRLMDRILDASVQVPAALQGATVIDLKSRRLPLIYDDGGRDLAGFKGTARDCVCRAVAIVTGRPYRDVYDELNAFARQHEARRRKGSCPSTARNGVSNKTSRAYITSLGMPWTPVMFIGSGTRVHLTPGELPEGRLIVAVSKHVLAVIDGVAYDTYDSSRDGTRCVYGYWTAPEGLS